MLNDLYEATGVSVSRCYQCGKCTASCPLADEMDYTPSHILRLFQLGLDDYEDTILGAYSIWVCLNCETCYARCPQEVDIPRMMDFLRAESVRRKKVNPRAKDILSFYKTFLDSIHYTGRLYEVGLIAAYKARSFHLLQDVLMAPRLFFLGKLKLFPHLIRNRKSLSRIFKKSFSKRQEAVK
ncbi:MAG: heterodisulfide reductase subunit C [Spirochaetes bacterium RBG_13_51_14]|nr:MAG: heterodisulfide reductase subunit C [Spirochaetes bacterium RBG_13_51_14]